MGKPNDSTEPNDVQSFEDFVFRGVLKKPATPQGYDLEKASLVQTHTAFHTMRNKFRGYVELSDSAPQNAIGTNEYLIARTLGRVDAHVAEVLPMRNFYIHDVEAQKYARFGLFVARKNAQWVACVGLPHFNIFVYDDVDALVKSIYEGQISQFGTIEHSAGVVVDVERINYHLREAIRWSIQLKKKDIVPEQALYDALNATRDRMGLK